MIFSYIYSPHACKYIGLCKFYYMIFRFNSSFIFMLTYHLETLRKYPTLSLLQNGHAASLNTQSLPTNTLTLLANIATGTTPSTHGIVGATWRRPVTGETVRAYDSNGLSFAANIADILLQETNGLSLVVSASAAPSFASALAAHSELTSENLGWRAHAYSLKDGAFDSRYEDPSCDQVLALSEDQLAAMITDVTVSVGNTQITFSAKTTVYSPPHHSSHSIVFLFYFLFILIGGFCSPCRACLCASPHE